MAWEYTGRCPWCGESEREYKYWVCGSYETEKPHRHQWQSPPCRQAVRDNIQRVMERDIASVTTFFCSCGGRGPHDNPCTACAIWHQFKHQQDTRAKNR